MSYPHSLYKYSITIHSDDLPMVAAIRGVAWFCQETHQEGIAWGGTGKDDRKNNAHQVTFHFTSVKFRGNFLAIIERLFTSGWTKIDMRDDDPAIPQNSN